jgi:hypothetical protein
MAGQIEFWFHETSRESMTRRNEMTTSQDAADVVFPQLAKIQRLVFDAFEKHGPMTARIAEKLPEFESYGYSTINKRIYELAALKVFEVCGTDRTGRAPRSIYRITKR